MPMGQPPLSENEIATLRTWIDQGAEWNPSGQPLQGQISIAPRRLAVLANGQPHPIDAFLARYAKEKGLPSPPLASDESARKPGV